MFEAERSLIARVFFAQVRGDVDCLLPPPNQALLRKLNLSAYWIGMLIRHERPVELKLKGPYIASRLISQHRWDRLEKLVGKLGALDIRPVMFKGGALIARYPEFLGMRPMADLDIIVRGSDLAKTHGFMRSQGYKDLIGAGRFGNRLSKGWAMVLGTGFEHQNIDLHTRVTEPPVCTSLSKSILESNEMANGFRIPDIYDCISMISLHVVRSGMVRPIYEYLDLLWYVCQLDDVQWQRCLERAGFHRLVPALYLSLRQAVWLTMAQDYPQHQEYEQLQNRINELEKRVGRTRKRMIALIAPEHLPLKPNPKLMPPLVRRSIVMGTGIASVPRVAASFCLYGTARLLDNALPSSG